MPHITEAESAVLDALWRRGPLSAFQLMAEVRSRQAWGDATIKTLLGRLMRKGAVLSERVDGALRYRALIERTAYLEREVQAVVDRLFHGDPKALSAFLDARRH